MQQAEEVQQHHQDMLFEVRKQEQQQEITQHELSLLQIEERRLRNESRTAMRVLIGCSCRCLANADVEMRLELERLDKIVYGTRNGKKARRR